MKKTLLLFSVLLAAYSWSQAPVNSLQVSFPGKTWAVAIDAPGFKVEYNQQKPDGRQYLFAKNTDSGMVLSITLEKVPKADPKSCPAFLEKRVDGFKQLKPQNIKYSNQGELYLNEYLIPEFQGAPIQQKNLFACSAKDGVFIDVHLSKVKFKPGDEKLFDDLIRTVNLDATSAPATTAVEHDSH